MNISTYHHAASGVNQLCKMLISSFRYVSNFFLPYLSSNHVDPKVRADLLPNKVGEVFLVGAGPGDVELLTLKAYRLIQEADVVLFDWLVDESVLAIIPPTALSEFVGKRSGRHSLQQSEICQRIVDHALKGKMVVRLKGGDPAIFARTAEETTALTQHHIPFAIVPGITSASGASAYTGIPLTHRDCAQSVRFVTAHLKNPDTDPDWKSIVAASQTETVVFYMGLGRIQKIMTHLHQAGLAADYPVAVINKACSSHQDMCVGTIGDIAEKVKQKKFDGPAMIICGSVVLKQQAVTLSLLFQSQTA